MDRQKIRFSRKEEKILSGRLSRITDQNKSYYDQEFTEKLKRIRPDWFKFVESSDSFKKRMLCVNTENPKRKTKDYERMWQYRREKSSRYDPDFKRELNIVHPDWFPKDAWYESFEYVKDFLKRNKGKYPSSHSKDSKEKKAGQWCSIQRRICSGKLPHKIDEKKKKLFMQLPNWNMTWQDKWLNTYKKIKEFKKKNDRFPSSVGPSPKEKKLGSWCSTQKMDYYGHSGRKMNNERKQLLEKIPDWKWRTTETKDKWWENLKYLERFKQKNNKLPSLISKDESEKKLAEWRWKVLRAIKRKWLDSKQILAFKKIVQGSSCKEIWEEKYRQMVLFIRNNNRFPSESKDKLENGLQSWRRYMNSLFKKSKLSPKKKNLLKKIPNFFPQSQEEFWETRFQKVKNFLVTNNREPSCRATDKEEKILAFWIRNYRKPYLNEIKNKETRLAKLLGWIKS